MSLSPVEIMVTVGARFTRARIYEGGADLLVLAHGAGADQSHDFMVRHATALQARGITVVTFNFFYTEAKRGAPDAMPLLQACYRGVIAEVRARASERFVIGGKSMGGRVASMILADDATLADGLVLLGYPLHPPKQPKKLRVDHLPHLCVPVLVVQGERDPFGSPAELAPFFAPLPSATIHAVAGGDHSLGVAKKTKAQSEVDDEIDDLVAAFVRGSR